MVNLRDVRQGAVVQGRKGDHVKKLYAWLAENGGGATWFLLPKPKHNLNEVSEG